MLETLDLTATLSKADYKARLPLLQLRLYELERACWDTGIPALIVFEGWDAAGKGTSINLLTRRLDPRGFKLHTIQAASAYEQHMPWLWRFWLKLPNYGELAIFDRSWYGRVLVERVEGLTPEVEWRAAYRDIVDFERALADDGYVIVKFFLHISKTEQERRFRKLEKDPRKTGLIQPEDWEHHQKYAAYAVAVEELLEYTDTEWGPWTLVAATNRHWARVKVFETLVGRFEAALRQRGYGLPARLPAVESDAVGATEVDDA